MLDVFAFKKIDFDGAVAISGIEINNVIDPVSRDIVEESFDGVTVRIDKTKALIVAKVIDSHIGQQGGFTSAGLTDDIHVAAAVGTGDAVADIFVFKANLSINVDLFFELGGVFFFDDREVFWRFAEKILAPGNIRN